MSSERDQMLAGEPYDPLDPELVRARGRARDLCQALNATRTDQEPERRRLLRELLAAGGDSVWLQPPFYCSAGSVVTRDLPDGVFAARNPCRVIRTLT